MSAIEVAHHSGLVLATSLQGPRPMVPTASTRTLMACEDHQGPGNCSQRGVAAGLLQAEHRTHGPAPMRHQLALVGRPLDRRALAMRAFYQHRPA